MTTSNSEADSLVRTYLDGRTLPPPFHRAVVWMAEKRLTAGMVPVLDAILRADIDHLAQTPEGQDNPAGMASPPVCVVLHRAYVVAAPQPEQGPSFLSTGRLVRRWVGAARR